MKSRLPVWLIFAGIALLGLGCDEMIDTSLGQLYAVKEGNFYGYIDETGAMVIPPQFAYAMDFSEGLAAVNVGGTPRDHDMPTDGKWGFIDHQGKFVINPVYYSPPNGALPFKVSELHRVMHDGYRFVKGRAAVWEEDRWIYIDSLNRVLLRGALTEVKGEGKLLPILSARNFYDGRAAVFVEGGWGYIDTTGALVIPAKYLFPVDFRDYFALTTTKAGELQCIDTMGNQPFIQYQITSRFYDGIATYKEGFKGEKVPGADRNKLGLMNTEGHLLVLPQFDRIGRFKEGLAPVLVGSKKSGAPLFEKVPETMDFEGGKWGYVDANGNLVINPIYDGAKAFTGGLASVKVNSLWGYIDHQNNMVFQPQFHFVSFFQGPLAKVILNSEQSIYEGKFAYINQFGDVVWIEK